MQRGKYRNVPVVSDGGEPLGVLDVLALLDGALSIGHEVSDGAAEAALTFKVAYKGLTLRVQAGADDLAAEVHARLVAARGDAVPPLAHMVHRPLPTLHSLSTRPPRSLLPLVVIYPLPTDRAWCVCSGSLSWITTAIW